MRINTAGLSVTLILMHLLHSLLKEHSFHIYNVNKPTICGYSYPIVRCSVLKQFVLLAARIVNNSERR